MIAPSSRAHSYRSNAFETSTAPHAIEVYRRRPRRIAWFWFALGLIVGDVLTLVAIGFSRGAP